MAAHGQAVELGEGLWGLAFYVISDVFGLIHHVPHVVVIASGGNEDSPQQHLWPDCLGGKFLQIERKLPTFLFLGVAHYFSRSREKQLA